MNRLTKIIYISLLIGSLTSGSLFASSNNSSHRFNELAESLCESAQEDRVMKLRRQLREARTHIRTIYVEVSCNGKTLLTVAEENQAKSVIDYLQLKASPEQLAELSN